MIVADNLHKAFDTRTGRIQAVSNVGFRAEDGRITGLLGPNGAGKTTTMRMLYTLMTPDQGSISVDGVDAARNPVEVRRHLGVLPDARGVYKRLTARENIAYFGELHGLSAERIRERIEVLSHALDMGTSSTARPMASRRASAPRPRSPAHWCTTRATSFSMNRPTAWT